MAVNNPFSPTFGASPPVLVGRDEILDALDDAFVTGPTHPEYTTLLLGNRGAGKTVMLNAIEDLALQHGWVKMSLNAAPRGLLDRVTRTTLDLLRELGGPEPTHRVKGLKGAGFGIDFEVVTADSEAHNLRSALSTLGDALADKGTGVIISIDELHGGDMDELAEFGAILQHVTRREQRPIAFVGAALLTLNDTLLADESVTFLQRCSLYRIGRLGKSDTRRALETPIQDRGGSISSPLLEELAQATSGYAFMVQLVGFQVWKAAADPSQGISATEVAKGIAEAQRRIGPHVHAPVWRGLSAVDQAFLVAMAEDNGPSELSTISHRLGKDDKYSGVYRRRLINSGMIEAAGRGKLRFVHGSARAWVLAHTDEDSF